jgi:hypothetical protein
MEEALFNANPGEGKIRNSELSLEYVIMRIDLHIKQGIKMVLERPGQS